MNKLLQPHVSVEDLLLYLDGELTGAARASVQKHLACCWKCRGEMEDLESAISDFMRYKSSVEEARGPVSRRSSAELRRKMEDLDHELAESGVWSRAARLLSLAGLVWARRFAAGILVIAGAWAAAVWIERHVFAPKTVAPREQLAPAGLSAPGKASRPVPEMPSWRNPAPVTRPPSSPSPADVPEIAALVKLHQLGADLGEPIETVAAADGTVEIVCRQLGQEREADIRSALAGIPGLTVRSQSAAAERPVRHSRSTISMVSEGAPLERAMAERLGGMSAFDSLANAVLEQDDALMAHAYALHAIEERFPPGRRAALNQRDRAALAAVIADHRRQALEKGEALESLLAPVPRALGVASPATRQPGHSGIFQAAQHVDRIVNVIFGGSPSNLTEPELGAELNAAREQLRAALEMHR